jgi:hypothetical protein
VAFVTADHPARNAGSSAFSAARVGSSALGRSTLGGRSAWCHECRGGGDGGTAETVRVGTKQRFACVEQIS